MTEKLNIKQLKPISTDVNLGDSDILIPTQKAVKTYTDTAVSTIGSGLQTQIDTINSKIPSTASDTNKLADKDFVNSSIATNTATFRGTYNSLAELEAVTADENDYGFVVSTDAAGNTIYNRYKYTTATTPASWVFEYALNNSSFTAAQWAAINSGASTNNINQIGLNTTAINTHIADTNNPHNVTKTQVGLGNVDNTSDLDKPISTATQDALDLKANIADLGTAAYTDSTDYATAAQGAKADTALQAGDNVSDLVNDAGYLTQHQSLSDLGITATAGEINVLDGITASTTELNYVDGVTSAIQTQIDGKQATISDLTTIRSGAAAGATAVQPGDLATVATSGSYTDLSNTPTIGNATLTIQKNSTTIDTFTANATSNKTIDISVPTKVSDLTNDSGFQTSADVSSAISTHNSSSSAHSSLFSAITDKIPAEATSTNKLADKAFVNSSISTNTAEFKGTYNTLADLEAVTADNNDYGFVVSTDSTGNTIYNRYKYNGTAWVFEYALNNSSFTATQWSAINSGATTTNIGQIATNTTNISNHVGNTSNPHNVTKAQVGLGNVDNTSDANKPVSTATQTALNAKANSADLATVATSGLYSDLTGIPSLATVATSGDYDDLTNKPTIPAAQVNSDWDAVSGVAQILNKPTLATVATSGSYNDLSNKPTIPAAQVNSDWNAVSGVAQILNKPTLGTMAAESASDYTKTSGLAAVATSGAYSDLTGKPTIPTTLAALTGDVDISSVTDGQSLMYDANTSKWKNVSATVSVGFGGITGSPYDNAALANELNNIDCGTMS